MHVISVFALPVQITYYNNKHYLPFLYLYFYSSCNVYNKRDVTESIMFVNLCKVKMAKKQILHTRCDKFVNYNKSINKHIESV